MKIDMIQVLADRKELQKIQQRMNTNLSEIEVKICPDCGAEHISDMEQCDICIMAAEIETIKSRSALKQRIERAINYLNRILKPLNLEIWVREIGSDYR